MGWMNLTVTAPKAQREFQGYETLFSPFPSVTPSTPKQKKKRHLHFCVYFMLFFDFNSSIQIIYLPDINLYFCTIVFLELYHAFLKSLCPAKHKFNCYLRAKIKY